MALTVLVLQASIFACIESLDYCLNYSQADCYLTDYLIIAYNQINYKLAHQQHIHFL